MTETKEKKPRKPPKGAGRFYVTPETLEEVRRLSGLGLNQTQIHQYFDVSSETWQTRKREHPELDAAVYAGRQRTVAMVANKLLEAVQKGNVPAIIFYLKSKGRFSDLAPVEDGGQDKGGASLVLGIKDPIEAAKIYQQIMQKE